MPDTPGTSIVTVEENLVEPVTVPPITKRSAPVRVQLATLADAVRINNFSTSELIKQLAQMEPSEVDPRYINAYMLTNQRLADMLAQSPTLLGEIDPMAPAPILTIGAVTPRLD